MGSDIIVERHSGEGSDVIVAVGSDIIVAVGSDVIVAVGSDVIVAGVVTSL